MCVCVCVCVCVVSVKERERVCVCGEGGVCVCVCFLSTFMQLPLIHYKQGLGQLLLHPLTDLGTVCPTHMATTHMSSQLLVSVCDSEDFDEFKLSEGGRRVYPVYVC